MKTQFVKDVLPGYQLSDYFAITDWAIRQGKRGAYITCQLQDRTGRMDAKIWQPSMYFQSLAKVDEIAYVDGRVDVFEGKPQVIIEHISGIGEEGDFDYAEFEPVAPMPFETLTKLFYEMIELVSNEHLNALLNSVFGDPTIRARFDVWPAAKSMHHAFRHGLLQHTLEVADIAMTSANSAACWWYPTYADMSLALCGAMLHDIGKIYEYEAEGLGRYSISSRGLVGHVAIGIEIVSAKLDAIDGFPSMLRDELLHIIASHHGSCEHGALMPPATPEAVIVHLADLASAQLFMQQQARQDAGAADVWSGRRYGDGYVYVGRRGTDEDPGTALEPVDHEAPVTDSLFSDAPSDGRFAAPILASIANGRKQRLLEGGKS